MVQVALYCLDKLIFTYRKNASVLEYLHKIYLFRSAFKYIRLILNTNYIANGKIFMGHPVQLTSLKENIILFHIII